MKIDICIIASRRPDLLVRTLASFTARMFRHFEVDRVLVNIDPIFGDEVSHRETVEIVRTYFPAAAIFEPETANFCKAVQRVWSATTGEFVFHLEDDWLVNRDIEPNDIEGMFSIRNVMQVSLNTAEKNWSIERRGKYSYTRRKMIFFGRTIPIKKKFPIFSTSPSFSSGEFLRQASRKMNPDFDPEKQFYKGVNPALEEYVRPFRSIIFGEGPNFPITDIGRQWRDERKITKRIIDSASSWEKE